MNIESEGLGGWKVRTYNGSARDRGSSARVAGILPRKRETG